MDPEQHPGQFPALTLGRGNTLTVVRCLSVPPLTPLPSWEHRALCPPGGRTSCSLLLAAPCAEPYVGRWQQSQCGAGDGDGSGTPSRGFRDTHPTPRLAQGAVPRLCPGHCPGCPGARSPGEVPSTAGLRGRRGEASPYLLSLCANTRAFLEPPCAAASRKAAKAGRLPSFCLLPSRCGWPCQADGSAPGRDGRRRQEQLAPSEPGPRAELLSSAGSSREAGEAVTSLARLGLCPAPLGSALNVRCAGSSCIPRGPRESCWHPAVPWRGQVPLGDKPRAQG